MCCKTITTNLLTIVCLLFEPIISLVKPKSSPEAYLSIRQPPWTVKPSKHVIATSFYRLFSFDSILISNIYWWSTVFSHVGNSGSLCGGRNITVEMKHTASKNFLSIIDLAKGRYVLFWGPSLRWKLLLKQYWASHSENYLILINFP